MCLRVCVIVLFSKRLSCPVSMQCLCPMSVSMLLGYSGHELTFLGCVNFSMMEMMDFWSHFS